MSISDVEVGDKVELIEDQKNIGRTFKEGEVGEVIDIVKNDLFDGGKAFHVDFSKPTDDIESDGELITGISNFKNVN